jgi:hypothetical protein
MATDFEKSAYETHHELFRHYSALLFQARVLIITVILASVAYMFGVMRSSDTSSVTFWGMNAEGVVWYMASIAIVLLFSMETAYIRRLAEVATSVRHLEPQPPNGFFFSKYKPLRHWPLITLYLLAMTALLAKFSDSVGLVLGISLSLFPLGLFVYTALKHRTYLRDITAGNTAAQPSGAVAA